MTTGYNIKTAQWDSFAVAGSVKTNTFLNDGVINGEIIKFKVQGAASPGSIWFGEGSGASALVFATKNNLTSGTNAIEFYPRAYVSDPTGNGALILGSLIDRVVVNAPLFMALSGMTSGPGNTFGPVTVYYR